MRPLSRAASLSLLALVWLVVFFGLYVFFVHTSAGRGLDNRIFQAVPRHQSTWFRLSGGLLGNEALLAVGGGGLALIVGLRRRRFRHLAVGLATAALSVALAELLKHVLLSRPSAGAAAAVANSFPSGHAVVAPAVAVAIWLVSSARWRRTVVVAGTVVSSLVGLITVVQQWHRPSDVVSAYVLVAACACIDGAILARWPEPAVVPTASLRADRRWSG